MYNLLIATNELQKQLLVINVRTIKKCLVKTINEVIGIIEQSSGTIVRRDKREVIQQQPKEIILNQIGCRIRTRDDGKFSSSIYHINDLCIKTMKAG